MLSASTTGFPNCVAALTWIDEVIAVNGLHPSPVFLVIGVAYAASGLYYRLPMPVQPLKAMAVLALATGASTAMISVAALEMPAVARPAASTS